MKKILTVLCALFFALFLGTPSVCYAQTTGTTVSQEGLCEQALKGLSAQKIQQLREKLGAFQCMNYWYTTATAGITGAVATMAWNSCFCTVPAFLRNLRFFGGGDQFCWFCKLIAVIYNEGVRAATMFVYKMTDQFLDLLSIGILFFIVFKVGKMVSGFKETGTAAFATELFKPLLRALFAFIILASITYVFEWIVEPFLGITQGLTTTVFSADSTSGNAMIEKQSLLAYLQDGGQGDSKPIQIPTADYSGTQDAIDLKVCEDMKTLLGDKNEIAPVTVDGQQKTAFLANSNGINYRDAMLIKPLCYTSAHLITGMSAGLALITSGFGVVGTGGMPSLYLMIVGLMWFLAYFLIMLAVPFKMIDAVLRLVFVVLLSPLFVILWVFPATVSYTKKGWDMFLSSCVTLFALFFLTMLAINLLEYTLINNQNNAALIKALVMGDTATVVKEAGISSSQLIITLAIGVLCAKLVGLAPTLANALVGSSADLKVGDSLHKQIMGLGTSLGGAVGHAGQAWQLGPFGKVDQVMNPSNLLKLLKK